MPNGNNNPYLESEQGMFMLHDFLTGYGVSPNMMHHSYQGISPEIMGAIENALAFTPGSTDFFMENYNPPIQEEGDFPIGWWGPLSSLEGLEYESSVNPGTMIQFDPADESTYWVLGEEGLNIFPQSDADITEEEQLQMLSEFGDPWYYGYEGPTTALPFTDIFDASSIAETLSSLAGVSPLDVVNDPNLAPIRASEVRALTPEMIEKTEQQYYEPYETRGREELVERKQKVRTPTGGFAGSGSRAGGLSSAEKMYRGGYGDILADIMKMRGGATENVLENLYSWQELVSNV